MSVAKLRVPAGTFVQLSCGAILEPVQPNLLNSAFFGSGPPSRNSGLVMVNGWSALLEANAGWDVRGNESRSDRARRPSASMPVPTSTEKMGRESRNGVASKERILRLVTGESTKRSQV